MTDVHLWLAVLSVLGAGLAIDLWFHRRPRVIGIAEAAAWTAGWIALGLAFGALVWLTRGDGAGMAYLTGYAIEWSLSLDNIFVFVMILVGLAVPEVLRHRLLLIGALGAIVLRLGLILGGAALLHEFEWLLYPFGVILLVAAARFAFSREEPRPSPDGGRTGRLLARVLPPGARTTALPLLLIIGADVVFAVDSIPAIFGITTDPFIAFSSNALAVLGLRSLYFLIQGAMHRFRYLRPALALLLLFVGAKILTAAWIDIPMGVSLAVIVGVLGAGIGLSLATTAGPRHGREGA